MGGLGGGEGGLAAGASVEGVGIFRAGEIGFGEIVEGAEVRAAAAEPEVGGSRCDPADLVGRGGGANCARRDVALWLRRDPAVDDADVLGRPAAAAPASAPLFTGKPGTGASSTVILVF